MSSADAKQILGEKKFPSVNLRFSGANGWEFVSRNKIHTLSLREITKTINYLQNKVEYKINLKDIVLYFELTGTSPSRQGLLKLSKYKKSANVETIARLTCH